jgi:hypothetical protein
MVIRLCSEEHKVSDALRMHVGRVDSAPYSFLKFFLKCTQAIHSTLHILAPVNEEVLPVKPLMWAP